MTLERDMDKVDESLKLRLSIELGKYKETVSYSHEAIGIFLKYGDLENPLITYLKSWAKDIENGKYYTEKGQKSLRLSSGHAWGVAPEDRRQYDKVR